MLDKVGAWPSHSDPQAAVLSQDSGPTDAWLLTPSFFHFLGCRRADWGPAESVIASL